jgi:PDZ domain
VAVVVGVLYLAALGVGWTALSRAGDYGVLATVAGPDGRPALASLVPEGPAERAGIHAGDVLLAVDGAPVDADTHWDALYRTTRASGQSSTLTIQAGSADVAGTASGAMQDHVVTLQSRAANVDVRSRTISYGVTGLSLLALGMVVLLRRPTARPAWMYLLFAGAAAFGLATAVWTIGLKDAWVDRSHMASTALASAALLHLFLVFPTPSQPLGGWRWPWPSARPPFAIAIVVVYVVPVLAALVWTDTQLGPYLYLLDMVWVAIACGVLVRQYRGAAGPTARAQLLWMLSGLSIALLATLVGVVLPPLSGWRIELLPRSLAAALWVLFPLSIGIAIVRYRLFEIDVLINRALVYGMLTAIVAGVYGGSTALLQRLSPALTGQQSDVVAVIAAFIAAIAFTPVKNRLQAAVDRRFKPSTGAAAQEPSVAQLVEQVAILQAQVAELSRRRTGERTE